MSGKSCVESLTIAECHFHATEVKMLQWLRKQKRPLIEPHPSPQPPAKKREETRSKMWEEMQGTLKAELDKIVCGQDMPITLATRSVQDGDVPGCLIRRTCSDRKQGDDEDKNLLRKEGKLRRYSLVHTLNRFQLLFQAKVQRRRQPSEAYCRFLLPGKVSHGKS